jgi:hypothetical protein
MRPERADRGRGLPRSTSAGVGAGGLTAPSWGSGRCLHTGEVMDAPIREQTEKENR